jgi:hypothetical protein
MQWQLLSAGPASAYSKMTPGEFELTGMPTDKEGSTSLPLEQSGNYVALRVDTANGTILGVQGLGYGGSAVSMVCWMSFVGTA